LADHPFIVCHQYPGNLPVLVFHQETPSSVDSSDEQRGKRIVMTIPSPAQPAARASPYSGPKMRWICPWTLRIPMCRERVSRLASYSSADCQRSSASSDMP